MLVCEDSLIAAVARFLRVARIPRPPGTSVSMDAAFVAFRVLPALLGALEEIEQVDLCHGFSLEKASARILGHDHQT